VVWRDGVIVPSQKLPGAGHGKGKRISDLKSSKANLPNADPGAVTAHRWRKRFCSKASSAGELGSQV
jgi:hypothetical protein